MIHETSFWYLVARKAHARFPEEEAETADVPVAHISLYPDNLLSRTELQSEPRSCNSFSSEPADQVVVLVGNHHSLHVVEVISNAYVNFFDFLTFL